MYPSADVRNAREQLLKGDLELKAEKNLRAEDQEARLVEGELEFSFDPRCRHDAPRQGRVVMRSRRIVGC